MRAASGATTVSSAPGAGVTRPVAAIDSAKHVDLCRLDDDGDGRRRSRPASTGVLAAADQKQQRRLTAWRAATAERSWVPGHLMGRSNRALEIGERVLIVETGLRGRAGACRAPSAAPGRARAGRSGRRCRPPAPAARPRARAAESCSRSGSSDRGRRSARASAAAIAAARCAPDDGLALRLEARRASPSSTATPACAW